MCEVTSEILQFLAHVPSSDFAPTYTDQNGWSYFRLYLLRDP